MPVDKSRFLKGVIMSFDIDDKWYTFDIDESTSIGQLSLQREIAIYYNLTTDSWVGEEISSNGWDFLSDYDVNNLVKKYRLKDYIPKIIAYPSKTLYKIPEKSEDSDA